MLTEKAAMYSTLGISKEVFAFGTKIEEELKERFAKIDEIAEYNQLKVIHAMQASKVSEACLYGTTGYGYNDLGRDTLEQVYAPCFGTEVAKERPRVTCGTHALASALSGNLLPCDELLAPVVNPYDTVEEVIGIRPSVGSLAEYGVTYRQVDLKEDGSFDYEGIKNAINKKTKMVTIQRSKGYQTRPTLSVTRIGELIAFIKNIKPDVICMVDNCYGEFVETIEPTNVGADLMVGSLIKNPGGGLAPTGGYIAGKKSAVDRIANSMTVPGIGREAGSYFGSYLPFYQGFFSAPHVVAQSLKTSALFAKAFEYLKLPTMPPSDAVRSDIVQSLRFDTKEELIDFCACIQAVAPVDGYVVPEPWAMPGYSHDVIMAAGTFVQGASIELSADAPICKPYTAYVQGALNYSHGRLAVMRVLTSLLDKKGCGTNVLTD